MKRIQLFEFEDQQWLPKFIRTAVTNLIVVFHKMTGTTEVIAMLLQDARAAVPFRRIVDLGSGSGGAMPEVVKKLNAETDEKVELMLSDLYPHPDIIRAFNNHGDELISYHEESLNATRMEQMPEGIKTMVNSFHHMPPPVAKNILQSAESSKQPFLVYEMAENNIPLLLWWLLLPLSLVILIIMCLFMTPFVRPLTWQQLVFTYLIPVIPLVYAWDGQASLVRTYTFKDIETLIGEPSANYSWKMGQGQRKNGKKAGYFILGLPGS